MGEKEIQEEYLYIYIDQKEHFISLQEMSSIVNTINNIGKSIAEQFTDNNDVSFEIYPVEQGSFKTKIAIATTALTLFVGAIETEIGKAFVEGLTGNKPEYYTKEAGKFIKDALKNIMEKSINYLEGLRNEETHYCLDKSIKEKSDMYSTLYKNHNIKAISFNENNECSIQKTEFYNHIRKGDLIRQLKPNYEITDLIIARSINIQNFKGKWSFKKINGKKIDAEILDNAFICKFFGGNYPLRQFDQDDVIKVLLREDILIKNGNKEQAKYFIEKIFYFNEDKLKNIPEDLKKYLSIEYDYNEINLFNQSNHNEQ